MNCNQALELLDDYLDGEATKEAAAELEAHLAECDGCRREWSALQATVRLLEGLPEHEPAPGFERAVLERTASRSPLWRWAAIGAVLVGLSLLALPISLTVLPFAADLLPGVSNGLAAALDVALTLGETAAQLLRGPIWPLVAIDVAALALVVLLTRRQLRAAFVNGQTNGAA